MVIQSTISPEWSKKIRQLLQDLRLTQAGLADRLGVSPATVSRWIQGRHEPVRAVLATHLVVRNSTGMARE